jgi:DNA polymerase
MHQRPGREHIVSCGWWLQQELSLIRPAVIVALGATAAEALLGHAVRMAVVRGRPLRYGGSVLIVTYHPAYVLRLCDRSRQANATALLQKDLRSAREFLDRGPPRDDRPRGNESDIRVGV